MIPCSAPLALLIVGDVPEINEDTIHAHVVRVGARAPEAEGPFDAVAFDLRSALVSELASVRAWPQIANLPLLLVSGRAIPDTVFSLLRADDGAVLPGGLPGWNRAELRRRLLLLLALGRARRDAQDRRCDLASGGARLPCDEVAALDDREALRRVGPCILEGVDVGIVATTEDGIVTFANRAAKTLLRLQREASGLSARELLGLPDSPSALVRGATRCEVAYPHQLSDGGQLDLELSVCRGDAGGGLSAGYYLIVRDVREEKLREAERRRFERLAAMGTMVAGFAHEVRNPVAAIRSIAEELEEELHEAGASTLHVGLLLQMVGRVERLVRTSLQFGRPAAPRRARHRPGAIVASAMTELRPRLRPLAEEIAVEIEEDLPDVHVDERHIAQVLVILLKNALDAAGSPSRVRMRLRLARALHPGLRSTEGDPSVTFEVINEGAGIAPDVLGRVFDPFFTTKPTGTGLGLSIAQQLVHENCGRLGVDSPPGGPTSFWLVVPT